MIWFPLRVGQGAEWAGDISRFATDDVAHVADVAADLKELRPRPCVRGRPVADFDAIFTDRCGASAGRCVIV
jgi:hypothetical protein